MYLRSSAFAALFLVSLLSPLPAFIFGALIYIFFWNGYELLLIGILIDSVFGTTPYAYEYTLSLGILLIAFSLLRPYLSWYNTEV